MMRPEKGRGDTYSPRSRGRRGLHSFSSRGAPAAPADALDVTCFGALLSPSSTSSGVVRDGADGLRSYQLNLCPAAASPRVLTGVAVTHHLGARRPSDSVHAQGHRPLP